MQFGESWPAWKWLRWRSNAVDGRDAADRTRFRILILLYPHRRDVDRAREALETILYTIVNKIDITISSGKTVRNIKPQ